MPTVLKIESPGLSDLYLDGPAPAVDGHQSAVSQCVHRTPLTRARRIERLTAREPTEERLLPFVQGGPAMHRPSPHRALATCNGSYE